MTETTPAHAAPDDDAAPAAPTPNYSTRAADQLANPTDPDAPETQRVRVRLVSALEGHKLVVPDADGQNAVTLDSTSGAVIDRDALDYFLDAAHGSGLSLSVTDEPDEDDSAADNESEAGQ